MSHTGIRIRILIPGVGPVLEGDSDFLHMTARLASYELGEADLEAVASEMPWAKAGTIIGGPVEIWIQPCELPDEYPDDDE
jgi:hypothetical protein